LTPVRIPPLLPEGSTLGLVCTGSPPDPTQLDAGREWVASQGYAIRSGRTTEARGGIHALSPKERAEELDRFLSDPEIDGILCVRGGSGTMGMLPHLDYAAAAEHPKPVIGMSDVTALHLALLARSRLVGIAGRMVGQLARERTPYTTARWLEMLRGPWPTHEPLALPAATRLEVLHPGNAEGPLLPCNFSLLAAMIGTP
jgi:muramoyltetrapeptide carboxypeptidase